MKVYRHKSGALLICEGSIKEINIVFDLVMGRGALVTTTKTTMKTTTKEVRS